MNKKDIINSIFFPRKSYIQKEERDHLVQVSEDVDVGVSFFIKDTSFDNILFFHGNAELAQEYDGIASFYHSVNCNLIVADYRGYGLSSGHSDKASLLNDSIKLFDYVDDYLKDVCDSKKLIVMGRSLGSASIWEICNKRQSSVDGCIIESGFATEEFFFKLFSMPSDDVNFELSDGFENLVKIKNYAKPLLIIHAEKDHIVPLEQAKLAFEACSSKDKKIVVVENANHNNIIHCIGDKYFQYIRRFIDSIE